MMSVAYPSTVRRPSSVMNVGIPVVALARNDVPVVEVLRVGSPAVAHVPLADHRGAVAGVTQLRDERRLAGVDRREQGEDTVDVAVGAGEDRRPRR